VGGYAEHVKSQLEWSLLEQPGHNGVYRLMQDLNNLYRTHKALYVADCSPSGFEWIDFKDTEQTVIEFLRYTPDKAGGLLFVFNMTPVPRYSYRVGVPRKGFYKEVLNTDSTHYGGSGMGNMGGVQSEEVSFHGRPHSVMLVLPPLAAEVFEVPSNGKP
ncbi:MAG: alpha amylase C-terminal domain-containing protein, partial [Candidatus Marsarchaeota archaeon]|nr:alpha amylase C-terminal domain-containing protein [Candidatus Marsarchaeota archaeon]